MGVGNIFLEDGQNDFPGGPTMVKFHFTPT